jgi:hypothetical protein
MYPVPRQTVQVKVFTAPLPRQWTQGRDRAGTCSTPRPPQTQQLEIQDMMPKGSLPVPRQKEQITGRREPGTPEGSAGLAGSVTGAMMPSSPLLKLLAVN